MTIILRRRLGAVLLALTALLPLAAAPTADARPAARLAAVHVTIRDMAFSPSAITVAKGRQVTWTNRDPMAHSVVVTSGPRTWRSSLIATGRSVTHTFRVAGTYHYVCGIHPSMHGTVHVR